MMIMGSTLAGIIGILVVGYCVWGLTLFFLQPKMLYAPSRDIVCTPDGMGFDFEDVVFESSDGVKLTGWFIPVQGGEVTVLFCHGNAGNMMHRLETINVLHDLGLNCFIFDYRGYGNSQGKPTERGTYLDVEAAYKWLISEKGIASEEIIIFGRSLGGSIAARLASKVEARGLVIETAFTSYPDVGQRLYPYFPVKLFARYKYRTIDFIKQAHCPVLFFYSRDDELIPFEHGKRLYAVANEPKEFVEISGSHNNGFLVSLQVYTEAWRSWLDLLKEHQVKRSVCAE